MRFPLLSLLLLAILPACLENRAASGTDAQVQLVRGPYLQSVTSGSIVVRWRTNVPVSSQVRFGTSLAYGNTATVTDSATEHVVKLEGLEPGTRYYYSIGTPSLTLAADSSCSFLTAPAPGQFTPVRVWATGDFGNGSTEQAAVRDAFAAYSPLPAHLWIWLGDNAYYYGTDQQYQQYVFDVYGLLLRKIPLHPAIGNHDYAESGYLSTASLTTNFPYFSIFTVPANGEAGGIPSGTPKYYSYNYSNIHFIALDSYGSYNHPGSPMYTWLESDLKANNQQWTIVYFHHPPYSKGHHDSDREAELIDMRTHIVPLLEKYKADLVLSGHSHSNERSYLIRGHYGNALSFSPSMMVHTHHRDFVKNPPYNGTVYAICGTSGQDPDPPQPDAPMPCMYFSDFSTNASMIIDVNGNLLTGRYLSASGSVIDSFSVRKTGPAVPPEHGNASCEISMHSSGDTIYFTLFLAQTLRVDASLVDMNGKTVQVFQNASGNLEAGFHTLTGAIDRSLAGKGVYIAVVHAGDQQFTKKFLIGN